MTTTHQTSLERRMLNLYDELHSNPSVARAKQIEVQLFSILVDPELFRYLAGDPSLVPPTEWVPHSETVKAVMVCLIGIGVMFDFLIGILRVNGTSTATMLSVRRFYTIFGPRAIKWLPFVLPNYGVLEPHPSHITSLTGTLPILYRVGICAPNNERMSNTMGRFVIALWMHTVDRLEPDAVHQAVTEDDFASMEMLGECFYDMLRPPNNKPGRPTSADVRATAREIVLGRACSCRSFVYILRAAVKMLEHVRSGPDRKLSTVQTHAKIIAALAQDVNVVIHHPRPVIKVALRVARDTQCNEIGAAVLTLMFSIWEAAEDDQPLRWSLREGILEMLYRLEELDEGPVRATFEHTLGYILVRTASRTVARTIFKLSPEFWLANILQGIEADPQWRAQDPKNTVLDRLALVHVFCKKACAFEECASTNISAAPRLHCCPCYNVVYCSKACQKADWGKHRQSCLSHAYRLRAEDNGLVESPFDMGFILAQVLQYLRSDYGRRGLEELARTEDSRMSEGHRGNVTMKILMDQMPVRHTVEVIHSASQPKPALFIEVKVLLRKPTVITLQPVPLDVFLAAVQPVSIN
ncbi:hypothetical protein EV715DRAFT_298009 [Schizophyllum commune]